jgi:Hint domain
MSEYQFNVWGYGAFFDPVAAIGAPDEPAQQYALTLRPESVSRVVTVRNDTGNDGDDGLAPIPQSVYLAEDLTLDGRTHTAGTEIIAEQVLKTGDTPAVTLVIGRICDRRVFFSVAPLAPGRRLEIASISDAGKRGQGQNCFARGTLIETPHGAIPVEHLQDGDEVMARDGGIQLIDWVGNRRLSGLELVLEPRLQPVRIMAGALTGGRPGQDLVVSQDHRLVVDDWRAAYLFGEEEILVPARSLFNDRNVVVDCPLAGVDYFHLLMADSSLVCANGLWAETMLADAQTLQLLTPQQRRAVQLAQSGGPDMESQCAALPALSHDSSASIAA